MVRFEVETLGTVASVLVALSLSMKSMLALRIVNLIGAIALVIYGYLISSGPVLFLNFYVGCMDVYYIYRIVKKS